jgi:hypothetical protein
VAAEVEADEEETLREVGPELSLEAKVTLPGAVDEQDGGPRGIADRHDIQRHATGAFDHPEAVRLGIDCGRD